MARAKKKFAFRYRLYLGGATRDLSKKWFVEFYDEQGKRQRIYGSVNSHKTEKGRVAAAQQLLEKLQAREPIEIETVQQKMYAVLDAENGRLRGKSFSSYKSYLNVFSRWLNGREVSLDNVAGFFKWGRNQRSPATFNNYVSKISKYLREIGREDLIPAGFEPLPENNVPARYFQRHQVQKLRKVISKQSPELWLFIQFVFYCFVRPNSELRFLCVSDIDFDDWKLRIPAKVSKNKKEEYVAIPNAFRYQLEQFRLLPPDRLLFPSPFDVDKPIGFNTMYDRHRKILRSLGFSSDFKLYSWKHTGAVLAVKAGINMKELQIQLRHHSLDMVDKYLRQLGVADLTNLVENFPNVNEVG